MKEILELLATAHWLNYVIYVCLWILSLYMSFLVSKSFTSLMWLHYRKKGKSTKVERKNLDEKVSFLGGLIILMSFIPAARIVDNMELSLSNNGLVILGFMFVSAILVAIPGFIIYLFTNKSEIKKLDEVENILRSLRDKSIDDEIEKTDEEK